MEGEKIRILLIEDNPGDARLINELLAAKGSTSFVLEHADRLSPGLARLAQGGIDVILLDLSLPDSQGLDGLNKISVQTPNVPVVVLSGLSDEAVAVNAVQEGAQDYLVKGNIDSALLVRSLRYAMERQHLRVAWQESEARYRLLADNVVDVIWTANMKWQITYVSPSIKRLLGYTVEEMKRLAIKDFLTPDSFDQAVKLIRNQMDIITPELQYPSLSLTVEYVRKDGSKLWAEVTLSFLWDKDGKLSEVLGVTRDITERKKAEEALRESEEELQAIFDSSGNGIALFDLDGRLIRVNKRVLAVGGYEMEEISGKTFDLLKMFTPESIEKMYSIKDMILSGKEVGAFECEVHTKSGKKMSLEVNAGPFLMKGQLFGFVAVMRDITERKRMEEELIRLSDAFMMSTDSIVITDLEGRITEVNEASLKMHGTQDKRALIGKDAFAIIAPEDREMALANLSKIIEAKSLVDQEYHILTNDGRKILVESSASVIRGKDGKPVGFVGVTRDITQRKRAEEALRQSEERYRELFENANDIIYTHDLSGNFTSINKAGERVTGYRREEVLGINISRILTPESIELARQMIARKLNQGGSTRYEPEIIAKDGHRISLEVSSRLIFEGNKPVSVQGIARDITERKQMEKALKESEEKHRLYFESVSDVVYSIAPDFTVLSISPSVERILGYKCEELVGQKMGDLNVLAPEYMERALSDTMRVLGGEHIVSSEYEFIAKDGTRKFGDVSGAPIFSADGKVVALISVARDITERKQMEKALKESEERFRRLVDQAPDIIFRWSVDKGLEYVSPVVSAITGYSVEELMTDPKLGFELARYKDLKLVMDYNRVTAEGISERIRELPFVRKDGKQAYLDIRSQAIRNDEGKVIAFEGILRDITERKLMDEALRQSEHNYRVLFESTIDGMLAFDVETMKVLIANQAALRMLGFSRVEDIIGISPLDLIHPDDRDKVSNIIMGDEFGKGLDEIHELRAVTKDGHQIWLSVMGTRIEYEGKMADLVSARDITERKQAEQALRESEEKFRSVAETASDAIISLDSEGKIVFWNQAAEAIFGYSAGEVMGKSLAVIMPQRFQDIHEKAMKRVVSTGERRLAGKTVEVIALRKDGSEFPMEFTVAGWKSGEQIYSTAIARDITERREMEQQLQLAGRLAAVGELAAGVAHELNNPLTAIQGFAQFITARKDLDENMRKDLDTIYRESQRAAKITQNLLSFARRHEPEKHLISINEAIEKTLELQAHPMTVNNIELAVELAPELPKTLADFHQMQQVFVNIMNNAEQAMVEAHGRGRLVIKTQKFGNMIRISFADDGPGIPEENLKRIFDPFFTTKEVGKGTDLGLSICYGLVEAHGGRIYARNKLGQGATFVVELPIASENRLGVETALLGPGSRGVKWKKQKEQY